MKRTLPVFLLFFIFSFSLQAQLSCGFDAVQQRLNNSDPLYKKSMGDMEASLQKFIAARKNDQKAKTLSTEAAIYYIPVVVHIIHTGGAIGTIYNPTDAQITGAIAYLNQVYDGTWTGTGGAILGAGDIQIKFVLATKDPNNNATTGINRIDGSAITNYTSTGVPSNDQTQELTVKNLSRWDPFKYYNIWIVNKIDGKDGTAGSFIAGYAYFPFGNASATTRDLDGTMMLATQMKSGQKTLPHEVGHAFNLYHVFEGETVQTGMNVCPPNTIAGGDACGDTDPVTNPADDGEAAPFSCRSGINNCYGYTYNDNTEKNFMNYTNCYQLFTNDQKARMQASAVSTMRASLATSWANDQGAYPVSFTGPAAAAVTPTSTLASANVAGIMSIELNGRKIYSLNATRDGGYKDGSGKWYQLFQLQASTTYSITVIPQATNYEQIGVYLDYNGDGTFNATNESIGYINDLPPNNGMIFNFTTPATLTGNIVRLRIVEDLSTRYSGVGIISNTTSSLTYGQAEDYPVFLQATVLPLKLVAFTGTKTSNNIRLQWHTENEISMDHYAIERSADGSNFISIGDVKAGNNNGDYNFNDASLQNGIFFYRLKMINHDGSFTYSKTINFNIDLITKLEVISNPFKDIIQLKVPQHDGNINFRLLDLSGKTVYKKIVKDNQQIVNLYLGNDIKASGIYILETLIDGKRYINKVVKE